LGGTSFSYNIECARGRGVFFGISKRLLIFTQQINHMKEPITLDNLPESLNFYDLNEACAALDTAADEMEVKGKELDNHFILDCGTTYKNLANKMRRIMKVMPTDSKMILANTYTGEVFDYAFRSTLGIKD